MGSRFFVEQNQNLLSDIVLNLNLDMIAGTKSIKSLRYISRRLVEILTAEQIHAWVSQSSAIPLKQSFKSLRRNNRTHIRWELASDHGVFYQANIPFIYYGVGEHDNYHSTSDRYENINQQFL